MKPFHPLHGKILSHDEGMGAPTPEMVAQRAEEIARINGRRKYNASDWHQAKLELHGGMHGNSWDDADDEMIESSHDFLVGSTGHKIEKVLPEDAGNIVEELVSEGMEEAEHERMLEAARRDEEQETEE